LDLAVFDTRRRAVALYFLDWDRSGRVQEVELLDGTGTVRDRFTVKEFADGKYLVIGLKGYSKVRIRRVSGNNAVLSGIFFDPAPLEVNAGTPVPLSNPRLSEGLLSVTATGFEDQRFCVDSSENLRDWSCITTNLFLSPSFEFQIRFEPDVLVRFHRAHIVP
jgi:hypothetical protein